MGYESKFYAVRDYGFGAESSKNGKNHCEIIATLDMGNMGYNDAVSDFLRCFDTESPVELYLPDAEYNSELGINIEGYADEDSYGEKLCYASDKEELFEKAKVVQKLDRNYEQFKWLVSFIKMFKDNEDILLIHYGY